MQAPSSPGADFWMRLDMLLSTQALVIDRVRGSRHPRYPEIVYPLDYGYLEGTVAMDGGGIDVWRGTLAGAGLVGVACTVDLLKKDAEIKLLVDCTPEEIAVIRAFHNDSNRMSCLIIPRS